MSLAKMFVFGKAKNQFALLKYYHKYPVNRENGFGKEFRGREIQIKDLVNYPAAETAGRHDQN